MAFPFYLLTSDPWGLPIQFHLKSVIVHQSFQILFIFSSFYCSLSFSHLLVVVDVTVLSEFLRWIIVMNINFLLVFLSFYFFCLFIHATSSSNSSWATVVVLICANVIILHFWRFFFVHLISLISLYQVVVLVVVVVVVVLRCLDFLDEALSLL